MQSSKFVKHMFPVLILLIVGLLAGCTPMIYPPSGVVNIEQLTERQFITADGAALPLKSWLPIEQQTTAIIVALHGFNDYRNFFHLPGSFLSQQGIACFAYDQRGFGGSPQRGLWSGVETYRADLKAFVGQLHQSYPGIPIYLLGESMGGAVIITTMAQKNKPLVAGIILSAPAVWARATMPWYQQVVLWSLSHTLPWLTLTGEGVGIIPSDNIEMLRQLSQDPLVIKETRVETIYGLVNLMDAAQAGAEQIDGKTLLLYGEHDEVIPKEPTFLFLKKFNAHQSGMNTVAIYEKGYHMLLRDLQAEVVWKDIAAWMTSSNAPLPSNADNRAEKLLGELPENFSGELENVTQNTP
jgi:alpha-beta hydrolase superfamily lysophospholipase